MVPTLLLGQWLSNTFLAVKSFTQMKFYKGIHFADEIKGMLIWLKPWHY